MSGQAMDLETRERANPTDVLEEMKRLAVEQLGGVPSALYAPVAEALDDAARRAGLIQIRRGDHIALLNLRQRNAGNVMRYRQLIAQGFEDFRALPNRMRNGQPLGLVEDRHLGFHYAGQKLAESIGQRFVRQLDMLDQRLESLANELGANSSSNPIGATRLAGAFLATFHDADLPETLRPLLFRQYEHELSRVLGDLYGRINTMLAAAGYGLKQPVAPNTAQAAEGTDAAYAVPHAQSHSRDVDAMERFGDLRAMLHAWRDGTAPVRTGAIDRAPSTGGPRRELRSAEVISVTSLLQRDGPEPYARALAGAGSLADAIREQLSEGARRLGLDPEQTQIGAHENDAIDLVGLLFESLFQTHAMLDRARRVYARLVLPYVKVALSDDGLFLRRDHPARRLFDTITEACEGNDGATPQDRELLERAAGIAQRIVADYNEDLEIFALASAELEALLEQQRKRVDMIEKRAAEAVHGKERLLQARLQAGAALNQRLRTPLTEAVAEFLVEHWQHHLLQTLLREGRESPKHADVLALADALIVVDGLAAQARGGVVADRLIALQPAIVECLVACGHDEHGATDWLAGVVRALSQPDLPRMVRNLPPPVVADDDSEQGALRVVGGHAGLDFDPDVAQRMRLLAPGEWLRLLDQQGEHVAAKVAWISPLSGRLLLVNRRGARVLVASAEQLAALVAEGRLVAGTEQAPFDEAMRQMRARLNRAVGQN
ncbi:DUF1631 family protein [Noviluteimonas gilva]|nr:DUF1631 family protein [Lysobacter gilvus]